MALARFETTSMLMVPVYLVDVQAPQEDVDRIMAQVVLVAPLVMGNYDSNSFQSADGVERYRPRAGAAAGSEDELRKRPGVVQVSFQLPPDDAVLGAVVEAIYQVHSYQEPCVTVREGLASRTKGLDDRDNPHRWWNTTGHWKKQP